LKIAQEEFTAPRDDNVRLANLCGPLDENLRQIEQALDVTLARRGHRIAVRGRNAKMAVVALEGFYNRARHPLSIDDIQLALIEARHPDGGDALGIGRAAKAAANGAAKAAHQGADKAADYEVDNGAHRAGSTKNSKPAGSKSSADGSKRGKQSDGKTSAAEALRAHTAANALSSADHIVMITDEAPFQAVPPAVGPAPIVLHTRRSDLRGRTPTQHEYLKNILAHDVTFGLGPAGTGKTYLAVACAVDALERDQVKRIVLTRPAVEAGERLGFLPGDLAQKIDPYLRPLYDALYDLLGFDRTAKMFERQMIEIAPLAYMRGRTLNHAFIILDEAQNTTPEQMKMFLTRIGFGSKAVVTGDTTQVDLPRHHKSGLVEAQQVLSKVRGIAMTHFTSADVVRHPLVGRIVDAYDAHSQQLQDEEKASHSNSAGGAGSAGNSARGRSGTSR